MSPVMLLCRGLLCGLMGSGLALTAQAQTPAPDWPTRPIRIIVPNPAGGTADVLPRMIAEPLAQRLAQPVVVENRPGAAGNIGAEFVYNAEPDGYTWLAAPPPSLTVNPSLYVKLPYDPIKDFSYIGIATDGPYVLVANPKLNVKTVQELVALL